MPAHTPTYRTAAAPAATWRQRIVRAIRRPTAPRRTASPLQIPTTALSQLPRAPIDLLDGLDLDQRVRQLGEW